MSNNEKNDTNVLERQHQQEKLKKPSMYSVVLHNDDFTTMEFVIELLEKVFRKSNEEAKFIANDVHNAGIGIAGTYTYEIAETKIVQAMNMIATTEFPLQLSMEKA